MKLLLIVACLFIVCKSAACQEMAHSATMPFAVYEKAGPILDSPTDNLSANKSSAMPILFPVLDIYSKNGLLVFHGTFLDKNEAVLRGFPRSIRTLSPIPGAEPLSKVLQRFPTLASQSNLSNAHYTILTISLVACEACSLQDDLLSHRQAHLTHAGAVSLSILLKQ